MAIVIIICHVVIATVANIGSWSIISLSLASLARALRSRMMVFFSVPSWVPVKFSLAHLLYWCQTGSHKKRGLNVVSAGST